MILKYTFVYACLEMDFIAKNYTWLLQTCATWDLSIDFRSRYDCQRLFYTIMQMLINLWH